MWKNGGKLIFGDDRWEASVVTPPGYAPDDYASDKSGRLRCVEASGIKCPAVAYQLAGTKKVSRLAAPG